MAAGDVRRFGVRSMSAPLRRVLLRRPAVTGDFAAADWRPPGAGLLARQHEAFGQLLTDLGCEVDVAPAADGLVDATYVRDPGLVTGAGGRRRLHLAGRAHHAGRPQLPHQRRGPAPAGTDPRGRGHTPGGGRPPARPRAGARAAPDVADLTGRRRPGRRLPAAGPGRADGDARRTRDPGRTR